MRTLITGKKGFLGRNLDCFNYFSPSRELDLTDRNQVKKYINDNKINTIIHTASAWDFKDDLKMFFNLARLNIKMIYFGSGAEYRDDDYGMSRGIMNDFAWQSKHVFNLRLYGCFGPRENKDRFITSCIYNKTKNQVIYIKEDKLFSYIYVKDLCGIVKLFLNSKPNRQCYTITDEVHRLSEIAEMIEVNHLVLGEGEDYYSINKYFKEEFNFKFTPLKEGIKDYEKHFNPKRD